MFNGTIPQGNVLRSAHGAIARLTASFPILPNPLFFIDGTIIEPCLIRTQTVFAPATALALLDCSRSSQTHKHTEFGSKH